MTGIAVVQANHLNPALLKSFSDSSAVSGTYLIELKRNIKLYMYVYLHIVSVVSLLVLVGSHQLLWE